MRPATSQDSTSTSVCGGAAAAAEEAESRPPEPADAIFSQLRRVPDPASPLGIALTTAQRLLLRFGDPSLVAEQQRLTAGGNPDDCEIGGRLVQLLVNGRYELHSVTGTSLDAAGALWLQLSNRMLVRVDVCSGEPVGIEEAEAWYLHKGAM